MRFFSYLTNLLDLTGEISAAVSAASPPENALELYRRCLSLNISGAKFLIPFPLETFCPLKLRTTAFRVNAQAPGDIRSRV